MAEATQDRQATREDEPRNDGEATSNGSRARTATFVGTAVAAMLLGGVGGAMKALHDRKPSTATDEQDAEPVSREEDEPDGDAEPGSREEDGPEEVVDLEARAEDDELPESRSDDDEPESRFDDDGPDDGPTASRDRENDETPEVDDRRPPREGRRERGDQGESRDEARPRGVSGDEAASIAAEARRQLAALLGTEPERVSGLERVNGGWSVELEVVEVARVPESTDVLATYELTLDDDAKLVSAHRTRRYRRSQIDDA